VILSLLTSLYTQAGLRGLSAKQALTPVLPFLGFSSGSLDFYFPFRAVLSQTRQGWAGTGQLQPGPHVLPHTWTQVQIFNPGVHYTEVLWTLLYLPSLVLSGRGWWHHSLKV
jgi:hypothetical protein